MKTLCKLKEARKKKVTYSMVHLYKIARIGESIATEQTDGCQGLRTGRG